MSRLVHFLSTHLLPAVTSFFALGISCALLFNAMPVQFLLLPLLTGGGLLFTRLRRHSRATLLLLLPFVASLGFVHGLLADREPSAPDHIFHLIKEKQEAVLVCTLDRLPAFNGETSTLVVDVHSLRRQESSDFIGAHGLVQLKLKAPWPKELLPGDQLAIRARLDRPYTFDNPGGFDYPAYLARQDIRVTGRISSPLHIYQLEPNPTLRHQARYLPEKIRTRISSFIGQTVTPEISSIYKALLIGDASGISPETLEAFKGSGTMHILSISGAHLSILATFLFFTFYWLLRRSEYLILHYPVKKIAALLCLLPLAIYTLLAGANTPVIRSLIMVTVFMAALCADKRKSLFTPLALAALLILIWDPNSLFTASFQLSFMAVASIAVATPLLSRITTAETKNETRLKRLQNRLLRFTLAALTVSLAVTIGTAPLLLSYFNRLSAVGPLANLVVEPLICFWSLTIGFIACPLIFLMPGAAALLLRIGGSGLSASLKLSSFFSDLPWANLWLPTPSPTLIVLYYLTVLMVIAATPGGKAVKVIGAGAWGLALLLFIFPPAELLKNRRSGSEITFLDVGQGSSTFIQLPSGKRVLIDGGGGEASPSFNVGEDIIAPFLWQKGIKQLDAIIVTHGDSDHYNGLPFLLQRFRPATLWVNNLHGHDHTWRQLLDLAEKLQIKVKIPRQGEQLITGGEAEIVNLGVPEGPRKGRSNDQSLILRFSHPPLSCLFAGDITDSMESQLVNNKIPLQSTLLLAPHHGSSTSNSELFLQAVQPKVVIVSAGRFRPDNFPAPVVRRRCSELGIKMLLTADQGAITFETPSPDKT